MTRISTHVLDAVSGTPAAGLAVALRGPGGELIAEAVTDADGRVGALVDGPLPAGEHVLGFATGPWFAERGLEAFYPRVDVAFTVADRPHLHVPLLLSPFAYSTYRGS
ncbi:hydroxyisourate hydrolase [Kineococcus glutinatus]|uniref:5-hydroxyisourate hydrolase n=1 Tax=Kineococcus glutinatus TaxID=1070872 RepID=A0ABP9HX56_9ACTN